MNAATRRYARVARRLGRDGTTVRLGRVSHRSLPQDLVSVWEASPRGSDGTRYSCKLMEISRESRVHCTCDDYAYTFYPAHRDDSTALVTVKRPAPTGTGRRRSIDEQGVCKHLLALIEKVQQDD